MAAHALATFTIAPIPEDMELPPLPSIGDRQIETQVFTHSSYYAGQPRRKTTFTPQNTQKVYMDNEKLEHVGDGLIGGMITVLLHEVYPHLGEGAATILKAQLVRDSFFAQIARLYGLDERIRCEPSQRFNLLHLEKPIANLFESYVAGLFEFYVQNCAEQGQDNEGGYTPARKRSHGQAIDLLEEWIYPLFEPLAAWVLTQLQAEQARVEGEIDSYAGGASTAQEDCRAIGALARLNEYFIGKERTKPVVHAAGGPNEYWTVQITATKRDGTVL